MKKSDLKLTADRLRDPQYAAAIHMLEPVDRLHYFYETGMRKDALLRGIGTAGHGEQVMVKLALDLFDPGFVARSGEETVTVGEAVSILDFNNFRIFVQAMYIARGADPVQFSSTDSK